MLFLKIPTFSAEFEVCLGLGLGGRIGLRGKGLGYG